MYARDALLAGDPLMTVESIDAVRAHARDAYPQEAVGFLLADGSYSPQPNIAPDPAKGARVDPRRLAEALAGGMRAYCHSHPDGPDCPSEQDMRSQIEMDLPWVICSATATATLPPFAWGDQLTNPAPLIGRLFRHGVTDCYGGIRAWGQAERGILLPDFPRQWEWWLTGRKGPDLYRRHFGDAGFYEIESADARAGDVWLAAVRSEVPNHGGVYIGAGLAFHHASSRLAFDPTRLSRRDPIARWTPMITHWLRRDDWQ